jgi:hypothetical protein
VPGLDPWRGAGRPGFAEQPPQQLARRRTVAWVLAHGLLDQRQQARVEAVEPRLLVHDLEREPGQRGAVVRQPPGGGEDRQGAPGPDVRGRPDRAALHLLGGREGRGAQPLPAARDPRGEVDRPGDTEVDHPRPQLAEQDVAGLQVAVHDPGRMDRGQGGEHADGQGLETGTGERAALADHSLEVAARDVLGRDPGPPAVDVGVQHLGGAEAGHPPGRLGLTPEAGPERFLAGQLVADGLDRDPLAGDPRRQVHGAHAAAAQAPLEPVRPEPLRVARFEPRVRLAVHVSVPLILDALRATLTGMAEKGICHRNGYHGRPPEAVRPTAITRGTLRRTADPATPAAG